MHPDVILAGLRRELDRHPERAEAIQAEIERVKELPRPAAAVDEVTRVADPRQRYLEGLFREFDRAGADRRPAIQAEIDRVTKELAGGQVERAVDGASVERAVSAPGERAGGRPQASPRPKS